MTAPLSPVNPIRVALMARLKAIPSLWNPTRNDANVWHEGDVPVATKGQPVPLPRVVIGSHSQTKRGASRYNGDLRWTGSVFLRCWAIRSWDAEVLFNDVLESLESSPLVIDGHRPLGMLLDRVEDFPEPDPTITAHVTVGRLELGVQRAVA